jgi:hypothetical protein
MLTREQELFLIQLGIQYLNTLTTKHGPNYGKEPWNKGKKTGPRKKKGHNGHKWTDAQRERFKATMKKKYGKRFASE